MQDFHNELATGGTSPSTLTDKCASYSECLWLKFSVWKYDIVLPILYHSPHAPNLFDKQQTAIFAHTDSAPLFDKLYNFHFPTKHKSHL